MTIRWSVTHETLAAGCDDPIWGRVEILYNGNPAGTLLQWCRVEIENESGSRDLSDVVVSLQYDQPEPQILSGGGYLEGSNQWFSWTTTFAAVFTSYFELPVADRPPSTDIFRRRDFNNPSTEIEARRRSFSFLSDQTSRTRHYASTAITSVCDLSIVPTRPLILGVVQTRASWTGLGVGALVAVALAMSITNIWVAVSVALLSGWFGQRDITRSCG